MRNINIVVLAGRLTRDMELAYTQGGTAVGKFCIAVNDSRKGADGNWTDVPVYVDVTVWGKQAENLNRFIHKGTKVIVNGKLHFNKWEKDGQTHTKLDVVAELVELGEKPQNQEQGGNFQPADIQPEQYADNGNGYADNGGEFQEDIPF